MAGPRRSLKMSEENWQVIDDLAVDMAAKAKTGSRAGLPSWRSLLYQLATGKLVVMQATTLADITIAVNRLGIRSGYLAPKRRLLARLRAANISHGQHQA